MNRNRAMKLSMPVEVLGMMSPFPGEFIRFIALCEVLGALGLILPGALNIRRELTPLAAAGLVVIMIGATAATLAVMGPAMASVNLVIGIVAALVAYGRRSWVMERRAARTVSLQPAS